MKEVHQGYIFVLLLIYWYFVGGEWDIGKDITNSSYLFDDLIYLNLGCFERINNQLYVCKRV